MAVAINSGANRQLVTTDDFVVAVADNTGAVNPLPAIRKAIGTERWALLKSRGYV